MSRNFSQADIKITICDQLNQPQYVIEKFNVPYDGYMTGDFNVRGELLPKKTYYTVPKDDRAISRVNPPL